MTADVAFRRIKKLWSPSRATFEVLFAGVYELYLDKSKAPDIAADLRGPIGLWLAHCWPERYPGPEDGGLEYLVFTQYPIAQKEELLRATERVLRDMENSRLDPRFDWNRAAKGNFVSLLRELVVLMKTDMATHPARHD